MMMDTLTIYYKYEEQRERLQKILDANKRT